MCVCVQAKRAFGKGRKHKAGKQARRGGGSDDDAEDEEEEDGDGDDDGEDSNTMESAEDWHWVLADGTESSVCRCRSALWCELTELDCRVDGGSHARRQF
jgi:hypothetical protein